LDELNEISSTFSETIRNSDLHEVTEGLAETFLDTMLHEGVLRELPIFGSLIGIGKTVFNIRNSLFLKKIIFFLSEMGHVPVEKRRKMIDSINQDQNQKIKVGEKLIYIIDKCDDHIGAKYVAQFFSAFLEEKISYGEFKKGARIIQNIFIEDLEYFLETNISEFEKTVSTEEAPDEDIFPLINAGVCGFGYNQVSVEDQWDHEMSNRYIVEGGDTEIWVTSIGKKIKEILKKEE
jgi:hypothetical protein